MQKINSRQITRNLRISKRSISTGITEGTIIEITVTKPGEEPITTNMKVQQSDLELLQELQDIAKM